jgi:regulator of protease activity HflC (stomatin/prohibitin superfamily)
MRDRIIIALFVAFAVLAGGTIAGTWLFYNWCDYGYSLYITRKTGEPAPSGQYAGEGQKGVLEHMRGPGRHFLNPWTYAAKQVEDVRIPAEYVGIVKSNVGKPLPKGRRLAEPGEKGTQRAVLTPGVWRVNTFGQVVEIQKATVIEPGYVGVQTLREGDQRGILDRVLQAGYYNINPARITVDQVEIGYRVWEAQVTYSGQGRARQLVEGTGVSFPLADGKQMHLDITVVWGIFPEDAPRIIGEYGTVAMVENKIIEPQVLSICKNAGSNLTTQQFIEGETREQFQNKVTESLQAIGREKGIHFLIALVRSFHPAADIRATIQARMIAEEEKVTLLVEQQRDGTSANLEEATRRVEVASKDFDAESIALVQEELERGRKMAAEIQAEADRLVAQLERQTAELNAEIVKILGQADADVIEAKKKAEATKLQLLIDAYGGADPYNLATFAESLPDDIRIEYRYAGEGTFWTDPKANLLESAARRFLGGGSSTPKKGE